MCKGERRTETVEEFLRRGGRIVKVPSGDATPIQVVGHTRTHPKPTDYDDWKDGLSPNLRWIGGRDGEG